VGWAESHDLYGQAYTPWEWQPKLKQVANDLGLDLFSSAFDDTAVDFLEEMGVPVHKLALPPAGGNASFQLADQKKTNWEGRSLSTSITPNTMYSNRGFSRSPQEIAAEMMESRNQKEAVSHTNPEQNGTSEAPGNGANATT
jgi:NeuB family